MIEEINFKQIKEGEIGKEANPIILKVLQNGGRVIFKMEKSSLVIRTTENPEIIKRIDELTALDYKNDE
jgi:hypothetical protein